MPVNPGINDTICAIATPPGYGAIAIIRLSGPDSLEIGNDVFTPRRNDFDLRSAKTHTIHFGTISDENGLLDEVLVSVFKKPHSYTGEDSLEISCHGARYIQQKIIELLIRKGARQARPGEFTLRAFMNGKFDLSQAEAVADLIAASSRTAHDLALNQMRGGFSDKIKSLRTKLVDFASLIELELDFSEEDVQFADRTQLIDLLKDLREELTHLVSSFSYGNVIKTGIPVAIIGKPNVGKSTLLNAILNEERAIVSEIPGTTRDTVEDTIVIQDLAFRFIDTAGLRQARDRIESLGIERTYEKINQASIVLYVFDISDTTGPEIKEALKDFKKHILPDPKDHKRHARKFILVANKIDKLDEAKSSFKDFLQMECLFVSAKRKENINLILEKLVKSVSEFSIQDQSLVSNLRHYEALTKSLEAIESVIQGIDNKLSPDLLTIDIHLALHHLGQITGEITNDEILGNIFSKFCIGK